MGREPETLGDYLTVGEAADRLGVSISTLRNWDRSGKLAARRHPINGYRLYVRDDLEAFLQRIHSRDKPKRNKGKHDR